MACIVSHYCRTQVLARDGMHSQSLLQDTGQSLAKDGMHSQSLLQDTGTGQRWHAQLVTTAGHRDWLEMACIVSHYCRTQGLARDGMHSQSLLLQLEMACIVTLLQDTGTGQRWHAQLVTTAGHKELHAQLVTTAGHRYWLEMACIVSQSLQDTGTSQDGMHSQSLLQDTGTEMACIVSHYCRTQGLARDGMHSYYCRNRDWLEMACIVSHYCRTQGLARDGMHSQSLLQDTGTGQRWHAQLVTTAGHKELARTHRTGTQVEMACIVSHYCRTQGGTAQLEMACMHSQSLAGHRDCQRWLVSYCRTQGLQRWHAQLVTTAGHRDWLEMACTVSHYCRTEGLARDGMLVSHLAHALGCLKFYTEDLGDSACFLLSIICLYFDLLQVV